MVDRGRQILENFMRMRRAVVDQPEEESERGQPGAGRKSAAVTMTILSSKINPAGMAERANRWQSEDRTRWR
jgi:hypothetical protein